MNEKTFIKVVWFYIALAIINFIVWWILPYDYTIEVLICLGLIIIAFMITNYFWPEKKVENEK